VNLHGTGAVSNHRSEPEAQFRRGLAALKAGDAKQAAVKFDLAIRADRMRGILRPRGRFLSYYGLACALNGRQSREAIQACELALARDSFDHILHLNLARVLLIARKHSRALAVLERGLRLFPGDRLMTELLEKVDRRRQPVLRGLGRDNLLNRAMGRARYTFRRPANGGWDFRAAYRKSRSLG
jgi:tetratricopeptide (TPR) repeat protein